MEVAANENEASGVIGRLTETLGWMQWHINLSRHRAAKYFRKKAEVGRTLKWSAGVGRCRQVSGVISTRQRHANDTGSNYFVNIVFYDV